jgi:hypothetical protein
MAARAACSVFGSSLFLLCGAALASANGLSVQKKKSNLAFSAFFTRSR